MAEESVPNTDGYGPAPDRDVDPNGWLAWRSAIWADGFEKVGRNLQSLAVQMREGKLGYVDDIAVCVILDTILNGFVVAKQFYARESWATATIAARDLLAGFEVAPVSADLSAELERWFGQPPENGPA